MLKHLVLLPQGGLCNRMRVIASAKRLCQISGARCTVVWDWQNYEGLFEADPDMEIVAALPAGLPRDYLAMRTALDIEGGTPQTRRIPLDGPAGIVLESCHCFSAASDEKAMDEKALIPWLPRPARGVREAVRTFRTQSFPQGSIVGLHIRRADNGIAIVRSPDKLFIREARVFQAKGGAIFLATDNEDTATGMTQRFGKSLVCYPKNPAWAVRWPRDFDLTETRADYVDLLLLASCDHVLGSAYSSFTKVAMALNGSENSRVLLRRWRTGPEWKWAIRRQFDRIARALTKPAKGQN